MIIDINPKQDLVTLMKDLHNQYSLEEILPVLSYCADMNSEYIGEYNEEAMRCMKWRRLWQVLEEACDEFKIDTFWRSCWVCEKPIKCKKENGRKKVCVWCSSECSNISGPGNYD